MGVPIRLHFTFILLLIGNMADRIALSNLILAGFNLLPAFPMDGGRMLRALLSRLRSEYDAARIATWSGRMFALSLGLYGLVYLPMLAFVAFFIYLGAATEGAASRAGRSRRAFPYGRPC